MKLKLLLGSSIFLMSALAVQADTLTVGTPGDNELTTPAVPSPTLTGGANINFSNITLSATCEMTFTGCPTFTTSSPYSFEGVTISSPDDLTAYDLSIQGSATNPVELFDDSSDGSADITISLAGGVGAIAVGIADSDPNETIDLQALNSMGDPFGTIFSIPIADLNTSFHPADTAGNGYFVVSDTSPDIYGLEITAGSTDGSGLALTNVETTPEPASLPILFGSIAAILGFARLRKRA